MKICDRVVHFTFGLIKQWDSGILLHSMGYKIKDRWLKHLHVILTHESGSNMQKALNFQISFSTFSKKKTPIAKLCVGCSHASHIHSLAGAYSLIPYCFLFKNSHTVKPHVFILLFKLHVSHTLTFPASLRLSLFIWCSVLFIGNTRK